MTEAIHQANRDKRLIPRDISILVHMDELLPPAEWVSIKLSWLAHICRTDESTASRALKRLVECGHLERRDAPGTATEYRTPCTDAS